MPIQITQNQIPITEIHLNGEGEVQYNLYFPSCESSDRVEVKAENGFSVALVKEGEESIFEQNLILYPVPMRNPPRIIAKIAVRANGGENKGVVSHRLIGKDENKTLVIHSNVFSTALPPPLPSLEKSPIVRFDKKALSLKTEPNKIAGTSFLMTSENVGSVQLSVVSPFSLSENGVTFSPQITVSLNKEKSSKTIYVRYSPLVTEAHKGAIVVNGTGTTVENILLSGQCEEHVPLPWGKIVKFMSVAIIFCVIGVVAYAGWTEFTPKPAYPTIKPRVEGIYQKVKSKNKIYFGCIGENMGDMIPSLKKWTNTSVDIFEKVVIDKNESDTNLIGKFNRQKLDIIFSTDTNFSCLDTLSPQLEWKSYKSDKKQEIWVGIPSGNKEEGIFKEIHNNH